MTKANWFLYPQGTHLRITTGRGKLLWEQKQRKFDLFDLLMMNWYRRTRVVYLGFTLRSDEWPVWNEAALAAIEDRVRYDFIFENCRVRMTRLDAVRRTPAPSTEIFRWRLRIVDRFM